VKRLATALVLTAVAGLLAGNASSKTKTKTAHLGAVRATVTWTPVQFIQGKNVRLQITRSGQNVLDRKLLGGFAPLGLKIRDLDGDGEAEVLLDMYTGGAHCCEFTNIYRYTGSTYTSIRHMWGDLTYHLNDLDHDGVLELVSADDRFAYVFTAYAGSAFPILIWNYRAGKMTDVTRSYPRLIAQDAARLYKQYLTEKRTGGFPDFRGTLAAWMADKFLLGLQAHGWAKMQELNRKGEFKGIGGEDIWAKNGAYLAKLRKFLQNHGY
jgi:hypothetical protein